MLNDRRSVVMLICRPTPRDEKAMPQNHFCLENLLSSSSICLTMNRFRRW